MKHWVKTSSLVALLAVVMFGCGSQQSRLEKAAAQSAHVREQLASRSFRIRVDYMFPQRYPSRPVMSVFWLELKDSLVNSYLPYFGQVQSPSPYSQDDGLNFEAEIRNYTEKRNERKHRMEILFNAKSSNDYFLYKIFVYDDGKAEIDVYSNRRDYIRFSGELEE